VGNLVASSDGKKSYAIFRKMQFLNFIIAGFCSVCLISLFNPFITLWIGREYLLQQSVVILIVIVFYCGRAGMQKSINIFKSTSGLFYKDRYFALMEALINIALTIFLVQHLGLVGVFIGTLVAMLSARIWTEPYFVFHYLFHQPLSDYFRYYIKYGSATIFATVIVYYVTHLIPHQNWFGFIIMTMACCSLTIGIFVLLFYKTAEFKFFYEFIRQGAKKLREHTQKKKTRFTGD